VGSPKTEGEKIGREESRKVKMERKKDLQHFRDLEVYRRSFNAAMSIFQISKTFPPEERYSLVDQIRRSSRSVCANLAESWRKRRYLAVFKNKITDSMMEASETQCWLEFCLSCQYIKKTEFDSLDKDYEQIIAMLNSMEFNASKFCY
jgi:four helix bundle protein